MTSAQKQVKYLYEQIVGESDFYTLGTVIRDFDSILRSYNGDVEAALREIEYDMDYVMRRDY